MARSLEFVQVFYEEQQRAELYPFAIPYFNETLTPFFENSIIANLVPNLSADLISVCSWRLAKKRGDMWKLVDKSLTHEKIVNADFDIAILTPRSPRHQPLAMASQWHGRAWDDAFKLFKQFLATIGIRVPGELKHAVYENHFIATKEIYHEYINRALTPSISFINNRSLDNGDFMADSGYARRKTEAERKAYVEKTGRVDWPIAPFILERLFSIWIEGKGHKVISL